jgi:hypothetical protein
MVAVSPPPFDVITGVSLLGSGSLSDKVTARGPAATAVSRAQDSTDTSVFIPFTYVDGRSSFTC